MRATVRVAPIELFWKLWKLLTRELYTCSSIQRPTFENSRHTLKDSLTISWAHEVSGAQRRSGLIVPIADHPIWWPFYYWNESVSNPTKNRAHYVRRYISKDREKYKWCSNDTIVDIGYLPSCNGWYNYWCNGWCNGSSTGGGMVDVMVDDAMADDAMVDNAMVDQLG